MGFFGNKDSKSSKDFPISKDFSALDLKTTETTFNPNINAQSTPAKNVFQEISQNYHSICNYCKKHYDDFIDCPQMQEVRKWMNQFKVNYYQPIVRIYRSLPEKLTNLKFESFGKYPFKERLFCLEGLTLLVAIYTFNHKKAQFLALNRLLYATRNSAATYLLGGLLIAPEIYNPLLKSDI